MDQTLGFCTTADGVRLAYASAGQGPPLVKAANWLNHLEFDWRSPVWRHVFRELARGRTLIRYDERGTGLSDWNVERFGFDQMVEDLEAVVDHLALERFDLFGISQGCAVSAAFAVRHPERVRSLILYGGYARGWERRGNTAAVEERRALLTLVRHGWGMRSPEFRDLWTRTFIPEGTPEQQHWWSELQKVSTSPENAAAILGSFGAIDVRDLLPRVAAPTLVLHCRHERVAPFEQGEELARLIPGARFVALESRNHLVLEHEPAWRVFVREVRDFLGVPASGAGSEESGEGPAAEWSGGVRSETLEPGPPGLALAPFEMLAGGPEGEAFAAGLRDDLVARLTEWKNYFRVVVGGDGPPSGSGAGTRGPLPALEVRYSLEASVRLADRRLRLNAKLIDLERGVPLWSERFDRTLGDALEIQDEVARVVAGVAGPAVSGAEAERAGLSDADTLDAWGLAQRGWWHLWRYSRAETEEGLRFFRRAAERAPSMITAHYGVAMALYYQLTNLWHPDAAAGVAALRAAAERAIALDERSSLGHVALACALSLEGGRSEAVRVAEHAVALSPASSWARILLGMLHGLAGEPERGLEVLAETGELDSRDQMSWSHRFARGVALFSARRYQEAAEQFEVCVQRRPTWTSSRQLLAASWALSDLAAQAWRVLERAGGDRLEDDTLLLAQAHDEMAAAFVEGLRAARGAQPSAEGATLLDGSLASLPTGGALQGRLGRGLVNDLGLEHRRSWPDSIAEGSTIGRFRINGRLGAGGMGLVYRAVDTRLGRAVALKLLPEHLVDDPEVRARFEREARAASSLNHPNICTIFEIDEHEGRTFLAFELLEGSTLGELIAQGPLPVARALEIAHDVASGLEAAHGQGLVHRDVKPANLFVTSRGPTKILDFGVAKRVRQAGVDPSREEALDHTLTSPGSIPGTVAYMSPEQTLGRELDARSDLFSLGAVLYEALAGRRAFRAPTTAALVHAILHAEPEPLAEAVPELDESVALLVSRLLAKEPAARTPNAAALREELERILLGSSAGHEPSGPGESSSAVRRWWRRLTGPAE